MLAKLFKQKQLLYLQLLNGIFVIKFDNITIKIDDKIYQNLEVKQMTPIPALMHDTSIEEKTLNILSLESLQELHFKNIMAIHNIKREAWIINMDKIYRILY